MNENNIEKEVLDLIKGFVGGKEINLDTPLIGKGGIMDSITAVKLIKRKKKKFKIFFMDEDLNLEAFSKGRALVSLIQKYSK